MSKSFSSFASSSLRGNAASEQPEDPSSRLTAKVNRAFSSLMTWFVPAFSVFLALFVVSVTVWLRARRWADVDLGGVHGADGPSRASFLAFLLQVGVCGDEDLARQFWPGGVHGALSAATAGLLAQRDRRSEARAFA